MGERPAGRGESRGTKSECGVWGVGQQKKTGATRGKEKLEVGFVFVSTLKSPFSFGQQARAVQTNTLQRRVALSLHLCPSTEDAQADAGPLGRIRWTKQHSVEESGTQGKVEFTL